MDEPMMPPGQLERPSPQPNTASTHTVYTTLTILSLNYPPHSQCSGDCHCQAGRAANSATHESSCPGAKVKEPTKPQTSPKARVHLTSPQMQVHALTQLSHLCIIYIHRQSSHKAQPRGLHLCTCAHHSRNQRSRKRAAAASGGTP